jgi:hypothetical protein
VFDWRKLYQAGLLGTVMFGTNAEFDAISHLIGTAVGWGGNPVVKLTQMSRAFDQAHARFSTPQPSRTKHTGLFGTFLPPSAESGEILAS